MSGTKPTTESHGTMEISRSRGLGLSGSWPALVVDQTTKDHLRWNAQGRIDTHNLPITVVHLSSLNEENIPAVAIVSWRWDTEPDEISRNLLSAVILAKHEYIAYLFIDTISIDQRLPKDKLIKRVAAFSKLYSKLPVIVAYDRDDNDSFQRVMYRPWLLTELRAIRDNPYPVTYAGHMATKGTQAYGFTYCFEHIWRHSFMATIVAILMGEMQMTDTSDFRFILSPISDAIQAAYAQMNQQDYLLTVALLYLPFLPGEIYFRENIQLLGYEQYEFRLCGGDCLGTWTNNPRIGGRLFHFDIFLGGMRIGDWVGAMMSNFPYIYMLTFLACDRSVDYGSQLPETRVRRPPEGD